MSPLPARTQRVPLACPIALRRFSPFPGAADCVPAAPASATLSCRRLFIEEAAGGVSAERPLVPGSVLPMAVAVVPVTMPVPRLLARRLLVQLLAHEVHRERAGTKLQPRNSVSEPRPEHRVVPPRLELREALPAGAHLLRACRACRHGRSEREQDVIIMAPEKTRNRSAGPHREVRLGEVLRRVWTVRC